MKQIHTYVFRKMYIVNIKQTNKNNTMHHNKHHHQQNKNKNKENNRHLTYSVTVKTHTCLVYGCRYTWKFPFVHPHNIAVKNNFKGLSYTNIFLNPK